jgi:predicted RNase H-like nuclease (RuvC/YqgF family)
MAQSTTYQEIMILGHPFVFVDGVEYENLKRENQNLKKEKLNLTERVSQLENEVSELRHQVFELQHQVSEQDTKIRNLENKEYVKKLVMGLQDLNSHYNLEIRLPDEYKINLSSMRENRNDGCHILGINTSESRASQVQKAWRFLVAGLNPEVRLMLDKKCGGKDTVDAVVNYLTSVCQDNTGEINQKVVEWFTD